MALAEVLVASMAGACERCVVAGSIRRLKPVVKDIEIVAVPTWREGPARVLFDEEFPPQPVSRLWEWAVDAETCGRVRWIKPGEGAPIPWAPRPDGRYYRGLVEGCVGGRGGIKLDLFIARPTNFGLIYTIRTGSGDFSRALMIYAKRIGYSVQGGDLWDAAGELVETRQERDVFAALRLAWVEPAERIDGRCLRAVS